MKASRPNGPERRPLDRKKPGFFHDLFHKKPLGAFGMIVLILLVLTAVFADFIAPYPMVGGTMQVDVIHKLQEPYFLMSAAERAAVTDVHLLGTDSLGRDVLSYLIYGARTSVILCVCCAVISTLVSLLIGTLSAVIGGWFDLIVQRLVDAWQCIPSMLILLILMVLLGNGMPQMIIAISVPGGIAGSRIIRSAAMSVKDAGYVKMSQMLGSNALWEMVKHVLPNIMPIIIINMAGSLGGVVMMEASMNFLGYGVNVGTPSWGYLITNQGRDFMLIHPLLAIAPGVLIALMVFSSAMFGDGVRDILDPRLKGGVGSYSTKKLRRAAERLSRQKAAAE